MISQTDLTFLNFFFTNPIFQIGFLLITVWGLAWKGVALWKSARNGQRNWFIAMLVVNTFGILEIVYVFYFQKNKSEEKVAN